MKKRIVALLMVAVMCLGLLVACGEETPADTKASDKYIGEEKAKQIAIGDTYYSLDTVQYLTVALVEEEDPAYYTVSFAAEGMDFVYKLHAETGEILEYPTFF